MQVKSFVWPLVATVCVVMAGPVAADNYSKFTRARHDLKLGLAVGGIVQTVAVKPGDRVEKGDLLIELKYEEGKAVIALWRMRSESRVAIDDAKARLAQAEHEEQALRELKDRGANASLVEVQRSELARKVAEFQLALAQEQVEEAELQLRNAQAVADKYVLRAPRDGVVDRVPISEGEMVEPLTAVLQLVVTDPLWVDVDVPGYQTLDLQVGDRAWVRPKISANNQPIEGKTIPLRTSGGTDVLVLDPPAVGKIIHIARVADPKTGWLLVRVEIPNEQQMPAGMPVVVSFTQAEPMASARSKSEESR